MAGQAYWGNYGAATHAEIVGKKLQKELYFKTTWKTIFGTLNGGREVRTQMHRFEGRQTQVHIGNSSVVQEVSVTQGNQFTLTMQEELEGMAGYGDEPVNTSGYANYKHSNGYVNQCDSKEWQLPGRCSQKQAAEVLGDPKGELLNGIADWAAKEQDYDAVRACLEGLSRGLLLTTNGGLGVAQPGATAGQIRSCYNFYTPAGLVTPSRTQATHEANVENAITALGDTVGHYFGIEEADAIGNLCETGLVDPPTVNGHKYVAIHIIDPALLWRLMARAGTVDTLMKAALERGKSNPAFDHMQAYELDGMLYIPYRPLMKFRMSADAGASTVAYGAGHTYDPRTHVNASYICLDIILGAKALLRGRDKRIWITTKTGDHEKGVGYAAHYDDGWTRNEWDAKDGRTEMENPHMIVGAFYDSGIGNVIGT